jgi:AraC-like DNA-binding protein
LRLGALRCERWSEGFGHVNLVGPRAVVAFPRTSATIVQAGRRPVVANANHVLFYNARQEYRREPLDPRGYRCVYVGVAAGALEELLLAAGAPTSWCRRLPLADAPKSRRSQLLECAAVERAGPASDPLALEETLHALVLDAVATAVAFVGEPRRACRARTQRSHRELVESAKSRLSLRLGERIGLEELARELHTSPFHLARVFRASTGYSLHGYRKQLRARAALQELLESPVCLTTLAYELGYSSISHFSDSFRACFGFSPSLVAKAVEAGPRRAALLETLTSVA